MRKPQSSEFPQPPDPSVASIFIRERDFSRIHIHLSSEVLPQSDPFLPSY